MSRAGERRPVAGVVWVTGAAGGIGAAICDAYVEAGATVVASDVRACERSHGTHALACDVRSPTEIEAVIAECDRLGGIDTLVKLRRHHAPGRCARDDAEGLGRTLRDQRQGGISVRSTPRRCWRIRLRIAPPRVRCMRWAAPWRSRLRRTARVNTVAPGAVSDTDLEAARWALAEEREAMRSRTPLGELGASTDVASAVGFLGSAAARFITGATLFVDGGRTPCV